MTERSEVHVTVGCSPRSGEPVTGAPRRAFTLVARVDGAPVTAPVVVRTEGLTKRFPEGLVAVDDLDLEVFEGDLYGFLGPNGAGKSTTIRMLLGLVFPTAGAVEVLGQAVPRHSSEALLDVGALIEGPGFYPHLSGRRNLRLFDAAGRKRVPRHAAPADRGGHRARRPGRRGPPTGQGLLAWACASGSAWLRPSCASRAC